MAYEAIAAKSSHPALTVSPRLSASIPQHTAPTAATSTHTPYRPRRFPIKPSYLSLKAFLGASKGMLTQRNALLNKPKNASPEGPPHPIGPLQFTGLARPLPAGLRAVRRG